MDDNYEDCFALRSPIEELYPNSEKNIDNEQNTIGEQNNINTHLNNNNFSNNNSKNDYNENFDDNDNNINIQINNDKQNLMYKIFENETMQNKNSNEYFIGESNYNYQSNIEQNDKKTSNTNNNTINLNGKIINTYNEQITVVLNELYNSNHLNLGTKLDMQLLKKKKKRRTKIEIESEKKQNENKGNIIIKKKLGRKKKDESSITSLHSKKSDDNIMKKINSFFLESVRNWLNNSFLDGKGNFESQIERIKLKKKLFLKIKPKYITINLKKQCVINNINQKFKNILSQDISNKYKNFSKDENKDLIEEIYENNNQPFIIFILESTFIEILNYFSGQNAGEEFKKYFLNKNYDISIIEQFLNNFDKIKTFLSKINDKIKEKEDKIISQDYIERISLLCINYKECFEKKYSRKENKKKNKKI